MRTIRRFALLCAVAATLSGCAHRQLEHASLTLFSFPGVGQPLREEAAGAAIPYRPGASCYGWRLTFDPVDAQVTLNELLLLPEPAQSWGSSGGRTSVADDLMSSSTQWIVSGQRGKAEKSWCVLDGDPLGTYKFVVSDKDGELGRVDFRLVP